MHAMALARRPSLVIPEFIGRYLAEKRTIRHHLKIGRLLHPSNISTLKTLMVCQQVTRRKQTPCMVSAIMM
jgi:hypothetical protein